MKVLNGFLLYDLLLIIVVALDGHASVSSVVLRVATAAVFNVERLHRSAGFLDWLFLHFRVGASDLRPAPLLVRHLDDLLLDNPLRLLAHFNALANIGARQNIIGQSIYK